MRRFGGSIRVGRLRVVAFAVTLAVVVASGIAGAPAFGATRSGGLFGSLVVPSAESFLGGQQAAEEAARRANPEAVASRQRSRTAFAHLPAAGVGQLLGDAFPDVIKHPAGGTPPLPSGARVVGYPSTHAIQLSLPGHQIGILESTSPVAKRASHGHFTPVNLSLTATGTGYTPANSTVVVTIPRVLSAGIGTPQNGVSLTPVGPRGHAFGGVHGGVVGSSVVYPNTQSSTDTVVKPTSTGFQLDAVLRSVDSPQKLYFRVGTPAGSKLVQDTTSGVVRVVSNGATLATILPPSALDAAGTTVPASMSVVGHTVVVNVRHRAGSYLYPIYVDPEINDNQLVETTGGKRSNWHFESSNEAKFGHKAVYEGPGKEHLETTGIAEYKAAEIAYWFYETKGNSKIYELKTKTSAKNKLAKIESILQFQTGAKSENWKMLSNEFESPEYTERAVTICGDKHEGLKLEECLPASGEPKNLVRFQQSATASPGANFKFSDSMSEGIVSISETTGEHSTTSFNTASPEVEGIVEGKTQKRVNALYGSGIWLTKFNGALQLESADPGIGVATTRLEYEKSAGSWEKLSEHHYLETENACQGVQCYATHPEYWTVDPKLPDGEDKIRYRAEEAIAGTVSPEGESASTKTVKIDTAKPHSIFLSGLPFGNELSEKPYKLSVTAIDGEGSTVASSGIKHISLFVNGSEISELGTQTGCAVAKGECTAKAEWSINGAELGAGHHAIVIVATDNAGNEARAEETISIHHSTPVAMGPGSVDLQSGDFALGASDVAMGSGLSLDRNYSSRAVDAGDEGPLGPQWSLNLGTTQSLVEMVDGSVLLTDAQGQQVIFAALGEGEFESPQGDSNLTLKLEENKTTKEKLAYYLEDVTKHTQTKFTLPSGGKKVWVPSKQEGTVASDTVSYKYQTAEAVNEYAVPNGADHIVAGPDGNLWFTGLTQNIGRMTTAGGLTEYSLGVARYGYVIAAGPDGNLWFSETEHKTVGKITPSGVVTDYTVGEGNHWGIAAGTDGNVWFTSSVGKIGKITPSGTVTEYSLPAKSEAMRITSGPDGNMWFTDPYCGTHSPGVCKIGKITPSGTVTDYTLGSDVPYGIVAGPDGNLWFTGSYSSAAKIGKITTSGVVTEYSLPSGSSPGEITAGPDGNLWFAEHGTSKIGRITTTGTISEFSLPAGSGPEGITAGSNGNLWFTESESGKIGTITPAGRITEPTEELAPKPAGVSCEPELKAGCRALKFQYATETKATGENSSQWGEYRGRLKKVMFDGFDPTGKVMQETAIAEYAYDSRGLLRAEWDPRISPSLKVLYGYDSEGHITALSQPGEEPWTFVYGTTSNDLGRGRLIKAGRAPASEALWGGEGVKNTEAPTISGSPIAGVRLAVSNGKWSGSPVAYGYQWERCTASGEACALILGANNANYTPVIADVGYKLVGLVTATSGGGSTTSVSAASGKVETREYAKYALPGGSGPSGAAAGPDGNMWFTDYGSSKIGKVTPSGVVTEYALPAGSEPGGIVAGPDGNMWYANWGTNKIGKITTSGTVTEYSLPAGSNPKDITVGPDNNLWFTNWTSWTVGKITTSGAITEYSVPSDPDDITKGPDGNLWFTMPWSGLIGKITTSGTVTAYSAGSEPYGIVTGSDGNLWFADHGNNKAGKITTGGTVTEYALTAGGLPMSIASSPDGNLYVTEYGSCQIAKVTTGGTVTEYEDPSGGTGPNSIVYGPDEDLWVANNAVGDILRFNPSVTEGGISEGSAVTPAVGTTLEYGVPLSGSGLPTMTSGEVAKWGQSDDPVEATAILPPDAVQGWPASSYTRASISYIDSHGRTVNVRNPSTATYGSISTTEYNELNDPVRGLSPDNRQVALEAGSKSVEVAKLLDTESTFNGEGAHESEVEEPGTRLIETLGPQHQVKYMAGGEQKESLARLHTKYFYNEGAPSGTFDLVTKVTTLAQLANEEEVEVRKSTTSYSGQSGLGWTLRAPTSVTVDPEGKKLTTTTLYNSATAQITETRSPGGSGGESTHDTKFVYYSAEANTEGYTACGSHPEWAGLVCETLPAKQPSTGPKLPVTTSTYNIWNEPEVITEAFGSTARTKKQTYDGAGRLKESETTSTADTALPKVVYEYNSTTGVLEKRSTTVEGKTKTITSKYDKLGDLTEYIDADGNTTSYTYGSIEKDSLLEKIKDSSLVAGLGEQKYTYNSTTKLMEKLTDAFAGTFTASYDAEGKMTSEVYPNGMCANDSYNAVGEATHLEYIKTTTCTNHEAPVWYSETRNPSVRGETFSRTSTLASESYTYDTVGQLTEAHETPTGEGCSVRLYAYDEESNRTSQTTRTPGTGGKCATEGGTVQGHTYDEGNRLSDSGAAYDAFGNLTSVPAADAEGHELSSTFYVDNAVATQTQNGVTNSYHLDPEGRVRETSSGAKVTISHYDGSGEAVAWTSAVGEENIKRNIPGIDGMLAATQTNYGTPVLQLHDLQGDIVATAALSTSETKLLSTYNSTEFGVPNAEKVPPTFAWLGASDVASALPSGVITYGATSYVPQIGRALQSEAVEPPGAPGGTGAGAQYSAQEEPWVMQGAAAAGAEAPGREAAREQAAFEAAVSGEDPPVWWIGNLAKARSLGETYSEMESTAVVLNTWDLPGDFVELLGKVSGDLVSQFDDAYKWLYDAGEKLTKCSQNHRKLHECGLSYSENVYKFEVPLVKVGFTAEWPNFSVEPRVWECEFGGWTSNGNRWDECSYEVHIDKEL